jgi:hypothetical protein
MFTYWLDGVKRWPANRIPALLQTPDGPREGQVRWGFRWYSVGVHPELCNAWFLSESTMLVGCPEMKETFRLRRCVVQFDFYLAMRWRAMGLHSIPYQFTSRRSRAFGAVYSDVEGLAIIAHTVMDTPASLAFGPDMPMFIREGAVDKFLDNTTPPEEAFDLLTPFDPADFIVEKVARPVREPLT